MKTLSLISGGCVLAAVAFGAGALLLPLARPTTSTKVVNDSSETLSSVSIDYKTCGNTASIEARELGIGQSRRFIYHVCGEGEYSVVVVFADGSELRSNEQYVEVGNATAVHVTKDRITTH